MFCQPKVIIFAKLIVQFDNNSEIVLPSIIKLSEIFAKIPSAQQSSKTRAITSSLNTLPRFLNPLEHGYKRTYPYMEIGEII